MPKAGLLRGKQTYRCYECLHRFTPEGVGYSVISRVLGVKPETVYSWVKKLSKLWMR